jgi:phospholipase C
MMRSFSAGRCGHLTLCVVLFTLLFLSACGKGGGSSTSSVQTGGSQTTPSAPTATVVSMTASAQTIAAGKSVTLIVTATNANTVFITNNVNSASLSVSAGGGTATVNPVQTTTYTVTATGANNQQATAQAVIAVMFVSITAAPATIVKGEISPTLTVTAANATQVTISNNTTSTTYTLAATGGTQSVTPPPPVTTTYTATATDASGDTATAAVTVTVNATATVALINHVIFQMQENRSFDSYFGMLNTYRQKYGLNVADDGHVYNVDGIDDKLATTYNLDDQGNKHYLFHTVSTCLDDMTSAWEESYGSVSRWDFSLNRPILDDGFVHIDQGYNGSGKCSGECDDDAAGVRAMAYYQDTSVSGQPELNYYYYMASQFALSDRWFSPVSSKTKPNRLATMAGGTTQGLVKDPGTDDDNLPQRNIRFLPLHS